MGARADRKKDTVKRDVNAGKRCEQVSSPHFSCCLLVGQAVVVVLFWYCSKSFEVVPSWRKKRRRFCGFMVNDIGLELRKWLMWISFRIRKLHISFDRTGVGSWPWHIGCRIFPGMYHIVGGSVDRYFSRSVRSRSLLSVVRIRSTGIDHPWIDSSDIRGRHYSPTRHCR